MTRLPRLTGKEVISALRKLGFDLVRIKGSHHFIRHPDGRATVVPVHQGEIIGPGLMSKILNNCEITAEDLRTEL
jgi:predicted RNA binding protein YcfA (HicA-like mRNA interferase family)